MVQIQAFVARIIILQLLFSAFLKQVQLPKACDL